MKKKWAKWYKLIPAATIANVNVHKRRNFIMFTYNFTIIARETRGKLALNENSNEL